MNYRSEQTRLESFQNWPIQFIRPKDLAAAGFFYTKRLDRVRCFECSVLICNWEPGDNVCSEHQRWSAKCRFIRNIPCGNIPIGVDPASVPPPEPFSGDICGPYGLDYRLDAEPDTPQSSVEIPIVIEPEIPDVVVPHKKKKKNSNHACCKRLKFFGILRKELVTATIQIYTIIIIYLLCKSVINAYI